MSISCSFTLCCTAYVLIVIAIASNTNTHALRTGQQHRNRHQHGHQHQRKQSLMPYKDFLSLKQKNENHRKNKQTHTTHKQQQQQKTQTHKHNHNKQTKNNAHSSSNASSNPISSSNSISVESARIRAIDCPCADASLCSNVQVVHDKELYGFAGGLAHNVSIFNWTYLTSIAWAPTNSAEILCTAHENQVRLITGVSNTNMPFTNNQSARLQWIEQVFAQVAYYYFDGITFDYESPMAVNPPAAQVAQYTALVNETTRYFHEHMPGSQVSVCVAWQASMTDGRQYDYRGLAQSADYLYVMDYDTQSQAPDRQCLAAANAPFQGAQRGIQSFLDLQIPASKLILGVPWYGYNYTCVMSEMESPQSKYCPVPLVPFRGVDCSDAAGNEKGYGYLMALFDRQQNITEMRWDTNMRAPFANIQLKADVGAGVGDDQQVYQIWFDNPQSLMLKYAYAKSMALKGVGPYTFSEIYDSFSQTEIERAQKMWASFDSFFA